ncbi:hypothetical protein [Ulvibacterium sp.]|uniref:hypothetical protein n=1 Tax=Ulvibacterium sp. TaxID=2665914 RepID=UPI003BA979AE
MIQLVLWQATPDVDSGIDFISPTSLLTIGGAILAVVVIVNTTRHVFNWGPKWYALLLALVVSFTVWQLDNKPRKQDSTKGSINTESENKQSLSVLSVFLILVNGCLIYTSAFGIQNNVVSPASSTILGGNTETDEEPINSRGTSTSDSEVNPNHTKPLSKLNTGYEPRVRLRFNSSW